MGVLKVTWEIKVTEEVAPPTPPEEKPIPSWIYALPLIGGVLLALARKRRR